MKTNLSLLINSLIEHEFQFPKKRGIPSLEEKKNIYYTNYDIQFKQYLKRKTNFQLLNSLINTNSSFIKKKEIHYHWKRKEKYMNYPI